MALTAFIFVGCATAMTSSSPAKVVSLPPELRACSVRRFEGARVIVLRGSAVVEQRDLL